MYLFANEEMWQKLLEEIREWKGTEFGWNVGVRQRKTDCSHFFQNLAIQLGILDDFKIVNLPPEWYLFSEKELLLNNIFSVLENLKENLSYLILDNVEEKFRGDLLLFNIRSKRINHIAIYLGNDEIIHAFPDAGVIIHPLVGFWERHLKKILRLIKLWD